MRADTQREEHAFGNNITMFFSASSAPFTHSLTPKNTPHAESNHCSVQFSSVQFTIISGKGDNTAVPPAHLVHPTPAHSSPALIQTGSRESPHLTTHLLREVDLFRERAELS
jgi:hypothetical protein